MSLGLLYVNLIKRIESYKSYQSNLIETWESHKENWKLIIINKSGIKYKNESHKENWKTSFCLI